MMHIVNCPKDLGEQANGTLMSSIFKTIHNRPSYLSITDKQFPHPNEGMYAPFSWEMDIEMVKSVSTLTINMVAMILVAFAAVIVLVSLIVIKFRVTNSIDDGIVNIGVLKAIGYTSRQILASIALQFMLIAFLGVSLASRSPMRLCPYLVELLLLYQDCCGHRLGCID